MNNVRPQLKMLTDEQIQDIHKYTMQVLATTGVRVDSPSALAMLEKRVGSSNVEGRTVRIPAELVEWAIKVAPKQIQMYDRRGNPQFTIGGAEDRMRIGIHSPALQETYIIGEMDWGNIWVYGTNILLAGWLTREEFNRGARAILPGARVFQYDRTRCGMVDKYFLI